MAQRRMFSKHITDSDAFTEMPPTSQLLYFYLNMEADDDGFVSNPKKVMKMLGSAEDDYKILVAKRFIITFETGVCVIKHWLIHNLIRNDRYTETKYIEEKEKLEIKENKAYTERIEINGNQMATIGKPSIGKVSIDKDRLEESIPTPKEETIKFFEMVNSNSEEYLKFIEEFSVKLKTDINLTSREVKKFTNHWCEKSASGKKLRWEMEKTFEVQRRLLKWFSNAAQWSQEKKSLKGKAVI